MSSKGFTTIELMMVILFFGVAIGLVTIPLSTLQGKTALADGTLSLKDTMRRANTQSLSGYQAAGWGIHLSGGAGCATPVTSYYLYKGPTFDAGADTTSVFEVPGGAEITDVSVGGGCDVLFSRFHGITSNVGSVTLTGLTNGATTTITINSYGRISQ